MPKVYLDGKVISTDRSEADRTLISPEIDFEINKCGSFKFTMLPTHPEYENIKLLKSVIKTDAKGIYEWVPVSESIDFYKQKSIVCEGVLTYLNDSVQRPHTYENVTISQFLTALISNHNAQTETKKHFTATCNFSGSQTYTFETNYETTMEVIQKQLVDVFGGFLYVADNNNARSVWYVEESGSTNDQTIAIGRNLIDLSIEKNAIDISTVCIPIGKNNLTIASVNSGNDYIDASQEVLQNYGRIEKAVHFNDIEDASTLKTLGQKWLSDYQFDNLTINVSAMDLSDVYSVGYAPLQLSQKVKVLSIPHGLNKEFIVTRIHRDIYSPESTEITLGFDSDSTLSKKVANLK